MFARVQIRLGLLAFLITGTVAQLYVSCKYSEFQCGSNGQCISSDRVCDGKIDCRDGSDETQAECGQNQCNPRSFRCKYGACIDRRELCNGVRNCADGSDEANCNTNVVQPLSVCRPGQFQCKNQQCIDSTELCDGSINCKDRSDESRRVCKNFDCPPNSFQCAYGGCVDGNKICNGRLDCADGSDEDPGVCSPTATTKKPTPRPTPRPTPTRKPTPKNTPKPRPGPTREPQETTGLPVVSGCALPPSPEHGMWKVDANICSSGQECDPDAGVEVLPPGVSINYRCENGYRINGTAKVYCGLKGTWSAIPTCVMIQCEPLLSPSTKVQCSRHGEDLLTCERPILPGTIARVTCKNSYKRDGDLQSKDIVECKDNGQWNNKPLRCNPVCGVANAAATPLIVNGQIAKVTEFPWHATLYKESFGRKQFICGGTIIKNNLIVTAAHCVYNEALKNFDDPKLFHVVTGNSFQEYDSPLHNPMIVKKAQVEQIFSLCNYLGLDGNYMSDIAVLKVNKEFEYTANLLPICLDTNNEITSLALLSGKNGRIAGFGKTQTGQSSAVLLTVDVPFVPADECTKAAGDGRKFITQDKFCAGYTNGTSVCDGDSGGGYTYEHHGLYYFQGVVSVGLGANTDGAVRTCDNYKYSLYTKVGEHLEFLKKVISIVESGNPQKGCLNEPSFK